MPALGDLIVRVGGNIDGFRASMQEGSAVADQFTARIASTVSQGVTLFDQYGRAVEQVTGKVNQLAAASAGAVSSVNGQAAAIERMASAGSHATSEIQATSGALRVLEGSGGIRAAERFIATTLGLGPALQSIFPIVGAIALGEAILRAGEHLGRLTGLWGGVTEAEKKATEEATKLDNEILQINRDVARIDLEQYAIVYGQTAAKAKELANSQSDILSLQNQINVRQQDAAKQAEQIAAAQKARGNFGLSSTFSFPGADLKAQITAYKHDLGEIGKLEDELFKARAAQKLGAAKTLLGSADDAQAQRNTQTERDNAAAEAARKATEALKSADEDQLAVLKASHELSVGEVIHYWQQRLDAESGNAKRVHEIGITLGNLYQEQDKVIQRVAEHGLKIGEEQARKAEEWKSKLEALVVEAEDLNQKIGFGGTEEREQQKKLTDISAKSTASGEEGAAVFKKLEAERQYGLLLDQNARARIALDEQLKAADDEMSKAKIDALRKEQEAETDKVKKAELGLQLQNAIIAGAERQYEWETKIAEAKQKQTLRGQISAQIGGGSVLDKTTAATAHLISSGIDGISSALARATVQGHGFGRALADIGKSLAQSALTSALKIGLQAILKGLLNLIPAFAAVQGAQAATVATQKAAAVSGVLSAAGEGAAWGFESVMAALPFPVNVSVAPGVAAATFTDIMGFGAPAAFADGGRPPVGVPSIVGERGIELFIPDQPGTIIPNHQLRNFATSGGAAVRSTSSSNSQLFSGDMHFHGVQNPREMMRAIATYAKNASPQFSPYASR